MIGEFLGIFNDTRGLSVPEKIAQAVEEYIAKHEERPTLVLMNAGQDCPDLAQMGIEVRLVSYVPANHFWVGHDTIIVKTGGK